MSGDLNMNEQNIKHLLDPVDSQDAVNQRFLEANYLKLDSRSLMRGSLNINSLKIINLGNFNENDADDRDVPNIGYLKNNYIHRSLGSLESNLNANNNQIKNLRLPTNLEDAVNKQYVDSYFLKRDRLNYMLGSFNMRNNTIINDADLIDDKDAANKQYVDSKIKVTPSHKLKNYFKYIMEDSNEVSIEYGWESEDNPLVNYNYSVHSNQKAYKLRAVKNNNNYRFRFGFNMGPANNNNHTLAIELFYFNIQQYYWTKSAMSIGGTGLSIPFVNYQKFQYSFNGNT